MVVLERLIQKIYPGKWDALHELDKRYTVVESRFGFPSKKRYQAFAGSHDLNTQIIERQWESMAEMEATYEKSLADPEIQALSAESDAIIESSRFEYYFVLP